MFEIEKDYLIEKFGLCPVFTIDKSYNLLNCNAKFKRFVLTNYKINLEEKVNSVDILKNIFEELNINNYEEFINSIYRSNCDYLINNKERNFELKISLQNDELNFVILNNYELETNIFIKKILESKLDGILALDEKNNVIIFNKKFMEMWNFDYDLKINRRQILSQILSQISEKDKTEQNLALLKNKEIRKKGFLELKDGSIYEYFTMPYFIQSNLKGRVWSFKNIEEKVNFEKKIEKLVYYDLLTGLANRLLFFDRLNYSIELSKRYNEKFAILYLDLSRFKMVNDSLGHSSGDEILKEAARRIEIVVRKSDTVARMGGDEFAIILNRLRNPQDVVFISEKIIEQFKYPFIVNTNSYSIGVNIGIAFFPTDGDIPKNLIKNADIAMYHAKQKGNLSYLFYAPEMNQKIREKLEIENELRKAIKDEAIEPFYQVQIDLKTGEIIGVEALARWIHPEKGMISPVEFIPIAEETDLIIPLGEIMIKKACRDIYKFRKKYKKEISVSINVSGRQFKHEGFFEKISELISPYLKEKNFIEFEITESIAMQDVHSTIDIMKRLRNMGISIAIDDFGTGYSSLSYLKKFPVKKLKIDRSFIMNIGIENDDAVIVKTIIELSHNLGISVIAEGVETGEHFHILSILNCNEGQGYLFGKPIPIDKLNLLVEDCEYLETLKRFAIK